MRRTAQEIVIAAGDLVAAACPRRSGVVEGVLARV